MRKALFCNLDQTTNGKTEGQTTPDISFAVSANDTHKDSDKVFIYPLSLSLFY